jgi:PII-like signaling protein
MNPQIALRFYMHENHKHGGILQYEWLLEDAKKHDVHGGSAFRAIAGYGRQGHLHEQHFYELAGDLPVVVEFLLSTEEAEAMLARLREEKIRVFYSRAAVEFGALGDP